MSETLRKNLLRFGTALLAGLALEAVTNPTAIISFFTTLEWSAVIQWGARVIWLGGAIGLLVVWIRHRYMPEGGLGRPAFIRDLDEIHESQGRLEDQLIEMRKNGSGTVISNRWRC